MPDMFDKVRGWIGQIVAVVLVLIPLALALQVLVGGRVPFLGDGGVAQNLMDLIGTLGENGVVGLIALGIILYLFRGMSK
ncbi:MAG: hypothetical protein O3C65_01885 [Proteobacteria bacterium]|nr:hypothetical protein [Pseudomonadota bacterium]MDA1057410.1 hypothetical protein [Pseudomonadota bacterium]